MAETPDNRDSSTATGESAEDQGIAALLADVEKSGAAPDDGGVQDSGADDLAKRFDGVDWEKVPEDKLPKALRDRMLMHADYTKKTQALVDERRAFGTEKEKMLNSVIDRLSQRGVTPTEEQKEDLRAKIAEGNMDAIPAYLDELVGRRVDPVVIDAARRNAIDTAYRINPLVREYEQEISAQLGADPELKMMASAANFRFAPYVLAGLANTIRVTKLESELATMKSDREAYAKKAVQAYIAKVKGIPTETSRAGTRTATVTGQPATLRDAMATAWDENRMDEVVSRH